MSKFLIEIYFFNAVPSEPTENWRSKNWKWGGKKQEFDKIWLPILENFGRFLAKGGGGRQLPSPLVPKALMLHWILSLHDENYSEELKIYKIFARIVTSVISCLNGQRQKFKKIWRTESEHPVQIHYEVVECKKILWEVEFGEDKKCWEGYYLKFVFLITSFTCKWSYLS